jgi:NAD(P)-dependent dehydrogenase (short-subunit alcohol dehydrogenase family)
MFDNVSDEVRRPLTDQIPMNRMGLAEEVATPALFLASPDSTLVTGAEPCVDGGMTARRELCGNARGSHNQFPCP